MNNILYTGYVYCKRDMIFFTRRSSSPWIIDKKEILKAFIKQDSYWLYLYTEKYGFEIRKCLGRYEIFETLYNENIKDFLYKDFCFLEN